MITIKEITARIDIILHLHIVLGNMLNQIVSTTNKIDSSERLELGVPYRIMNHEIIYCDRRYLETKYIKLSGTCVPKFSFTTMRKRCLKVYRFGS